jgi:predicted nucleic acid-binding protein
MAAKVVDASALAAVLFGEPEADEIALRPRGHSLFATAILPFEIANTCLKKVRQFPAAREALLSAIAKYDDIAIDTVDIDRADMLAKGEALGLTSYDASNLCLAIKLGAELVTLDKKLDAAEGAPAVGGRKGP